MFFKKKKEYQMNPEMANAILQTVFISQNREPNKTPLDILALREKASTEIYDRMIRIATWAVILTFLTPLCFIPFAGNPLKKLPENMPRVVEDYVNDSHLYLKVTGLGVQYADATITASDGTIFAPSSYDEDSGLICFPYLAGTAYEIYIPVEGKLPLHLMLRPDEEAFE